MGLFDDNFFGQGLVSSRGDKWSQDTYNQFADALSAHAKATGSNRADPVYAATLVSNWLTAGAAPKPIDPGEIFGQAQVIAPVEAKAAAGRGIAGLFGFGKSIGEMQPTVQIGQAPLAPGVPYSAKPIPRVGG